MDGGDRIAHGFGELGNLEAGVGTVATTVVEEITDIVSLEHFDQAFVLGPVGVDILELVTAGAEGATGSVAQGRDRCVRLLDGVDQVFGQSADRSEERRVGKECRSRWWQAD